MFCLKLLMLLLPIRECFMYSCVYVDAAGVNHNGIKRILCNSFRTFFIKGKAVFDDDSRNLYRNSPDPTSILDI